MVIPYHRGRVNRIANVYARFARLNRCRLAKVPPAIVCWWSSGVMAEQDVSTYSRRWCRVGNENDNLSDKIVRSAGSA